MKELWKDVIEYEGLYQVSSFGNVRTIARYVNSSHRGFIGKRFIKQKIMKPYNYGGYLGVALCKNGRYKQKLLHRLVAEAFIPNPDNLPCVNHKDENRQNNRVKNLEWCTHKYNNNYGNRNDKISNSRKGMKFSDEHKKNLSIAGKKRVNDEFREKMRQVHIGRRLTDEHKKKISEGMKKTKSKT